MEAAYQFGVKPDNFRLNSDKEELPKHFFLEWGNGLNTNPDTL